MQQLCTDNIVSSNNLLKMRTFETKGGTFFAIF